MVHTPSIRRKFPNVFKAKNHQFRGSRTPKSGPRVRAMAGINGKGRSTRSPRHVRLYHSVMKTEAWRALDCVARCAYVELASRYGGPNSNNGRIPYSAREMAAALNVGKATAWRAMRRLGEVGFVVQTKRGTFSLKQRHATEWRLTEFPCDVTGALPTKEFASWKIQNTVPVMKPNGTCDETERGLS